MGGMIKLLTELPRWALTLVIFYAPWAHGSVQGEELEGLIWGSFVVTGLWALSCVLRMKLRCFNPVCVLLMLGILAQGWFMTWNAGFVYDEVFLQFLPLIQPKPGFPGSIDQGISWEWMLRLSALFGLTLVAMDASQNPVWRHRIAASMVLAGGSIVALGLGQHLLGTPLVWPQGMINVWPFATFLYHGNAGSYMNIVLPLAMGMVIIAFRNRESPLWRAVWVCLAAGIVSGPFINASKGATPITLFLLLIILVWQIRRWVAEMAEQNSWKTLTIGTLIILGAVSAIIFATGPDVAIERWTHALKNKEMIMQGRLGVAQVCLKMLPKAGLWGMGPDTFQVAFPYYTVDLGNKLYGFWRQAHQDYLQTLVEWGKVGAFTWALLLFGGTFIMAWNYIRYRQRYGSRDRALLFGVPLSILSVLIHGLYDFPLQIASIQCYIAILLGMAWGSGMWRANHDIHHEK